MNSTPQQSAVVEQGQREAAFERARRKLIMAAGAYEHSRPESSPGTRLGMWALCAGGVMFAMGVPLLMLWATPEAADPDLWLAKPEYPLILLGPPLALLAFLVLAWRGRRTATEEDAASLAVDSFFRHVEHPVGTDGMDYHLIVADLDHAPRRPPPFSIVADLPEAIHNREDLEDYWKAVCKYDGTGRCAFKVEKCEMVCLSPTLMLANAAVSVRRVVTRSYLLAFLGVALLISGKQLMDLYSGFLGKTVSTALFWGLLIVGVVMLQKLRGTRVAEFHVRKLVVKCGKHWRMFSGEWEGWEEADLSWLDHPEPVQTAAQPDSGKGRGSA